MQYILIFLINSLLFTNSILAKELLSTKPPVPKPPVANSLVPDKVNSVSSDFIIEDESHKKKDYWRSFVNYYNRHFKINFGTSSAYYTTGPKIYIFTGLNFNQTFFDWFSIKFSGELAYFYTEINFKVDDQVAKSLKLAPGSLDSNFKENDYNFLIRDSYAQFDITQYARLIIGRKTINWGQFLIISPIDLALPLKVQTQGLSLSKINSRVPQDAVILSLFPIPQMEIETYYFPTLTLEPSIQRALSQYANRPEVQTTPVDMGILSTEFNNIPNQKYNTIQDAIFGGAIQAYKYNNSYSSLYLPTNYKNLDKNYQLASRIVVYLPRITFGFTYLYGFNTIASYSDVNLKPISSSVVGIPNAFSTIDNGSYLSRTHTGGIEISIPIGKWDLKAESSVTNRFQRIAGSFNDDIFNSNSSIKKASAALTNWILNSNGGSLNLRYIEFTTALGFDLILNRFLINFMLLRYDTLYVNEQKNGINLYNQYKDVKNDITLTAPPVIPLGNFAWYILENKKMLLGFLGGYLGLGLGGSIYFQQQLFDDSFIWSVSLDGIVLNKNTFIDTSVIALESKFAIGGKISLSYTL